jgi:membrane protease YdiL (CAAX protease family)
MVSLEPVAELPIAHHAEEGVADVWRHVGVFVALTTAFSAVFWFLIVQNGNLSAGHGLYVTGLQWCPGLAGLITRYRYERTLATLGWNWAPNSFQFFSYAIPIVYVTAVYAVAWIVFGGFYNRSFLMSEKVAFGWTGLSDAVALPLYVGFAGTVGMVPSSPTALGEEIGWRGFLVPELAKAMSFTKVALLSGLVWAVWHYPLFIFAGYGAGMPKLFSMTCFTVTVVGLSFLYTWMRLVTGSVWVGMLMHASHNLFVENIFDPLTIETGTTRFVTGEFGIGLAVAAVIVAVACWLQRRRLTVAV